MKTLPAFIIIFLLLLITHNSSLVTHNSFARTTPEDIVNAKRQTFTQKLSRYTTQNQQRVKDAEAKITLFNKQKTEILDALMLRQGEILDEYIKRHGITERQADGINRNLKDPVENARYWLTYAHEAVAYQAAKVYIFDLTSEANISKDINSQISVLSSDLNTLRSKVIKSQEIVENLVKN